VAILVAGISGLRSRAPPNLAERLWEKRGLASHPTARRIVKMWIEGNAAVEAIGLALCGILVAADVSVAATVRRRKDRPARRAAPLETLWSTDAAAAWEAAQETRTPAVNYESAPGSR
jgi:hypothetical protein